MKDASTMFLESAMFRFRSLKQYGDKTLAQIEEADLQWKPDAGSNSIAVIIQHLHGNMMSRWTDFLTSDGEKPWRERDGEFKADTSLSREALMERWEAGWACLFTALEGLEPGDVARDITIRGQTLTAIDAIHRQLSHYGFHVGQIAYIAKVRAADRWRPLSIPKGQSCQYKPKLRD